MILLRIRRPPSPETSVNHRRRPAGRHPVLDPRERNAESGSRRADVVGAVTVTAATGALIYGMINAGQYGWTDPGTLEPIAARIVTTSS